MNNYFYISLAVLFSFTQITQAQDDIFDQGGEQISIEQYLQDGKVVLTSEQVNALPADELYAVSEYCRLRQYNQQARFFFDRLLANYPNEIYAPVAEMELGKLDFILEQGLKKGLEHFERLSLSPVPEYAAEGVYYVEALNQPSTVAHLELLLEILSSLELKNKSMRSDLNPANQWFVATLIERLMTDEMIEAVLSDELLAPIERLELLTNAAYACFRTSNTDLSLKLCDRCLTERQFSDFPEQLSYCAFLKGMIQAQELGKFEEGIATFEHGALEYSGTDYAAECLYEAGRWSMHIFDYSSAKFYFQQLHNFYQDFRLKEGVEALLADERVAKADGQVASAKETGKFQRILAAVIPGGKKPGSQPFEVRGARPVNLRRMCGPVSLMEVAKANGKKLKYEEAEELCQLDERGYTTMEKLVDGIKQTGFRAVGMQLGLYDLKEEFDKHLIIVHLDDHFAMLKSIKDAKYVIVDDRGELTMSSSRFLHKWDGYVIIVEKKR